MAFPSNLINLSSGNLLFADASKPWDPADFPNLPSTVLAITAQGRIEDGNVSTLTFTNAITYEPYEPPGLYSSLTKSLQIHPDGVISYREPTVGFVSTMSAPFEVPVTAFQPSTIGAPAIQDVTTADPDTITNAIGKLDAWITNAFLAQPPAVTPVEAETNVFYGGIRWLNFNTYNVLDKFVPFVTSLLFIIGDPASPDYCTFEINNASYFPYKTYKDGLSPFFYPIVRLRIFTKFFLMSADALYTKSVMQTKCVNLITEKGAAVFPGTGKVFAIQNTDGETSYTTVSIYLPDLTTAYPDDSPLPVKVVYLNKTDGAVNVAFTSTITTSTGFPSEIQSITPEQATPSTLVVQTDDPIYSDETGGITIPFFSTYNASYSLTQMNTAHDGDLGFRYGIPNPTTIPADLSAYSNATFLEAIPYQCSTQTLAIRGIDAFPIVPGTQWSTSFTTTNLVGFDGPVYAPPFLSTLFPTQAAPAISSVTIQNTCVEQTRLSNSSGLKYVNYDATGWNMGVNVSTDVVFMSTAMEFMYHLQQPVQWNDRSFPGDQSTMTVQVRYADTDGVLSTISYFQVSTFANDFLLNSSILCPCDTNMLDVMLLDSQTAPGYTNYFYNVELMGQQTVTTISTANQIVEFALTNRVIPNFTDPVLEQTLSTPNYVFQTEPIRDFSTIDVLYQTCTSTTQVAGIFTPTTHSQIQFDLVGQSFGSAYFGSNFAYARLYKGIYAIGAQSSYDTHVRVFSNSTEITDLPFPQDTPLTLSTCVLTLYSNVYQDPNDAKDITLRATLTPAAPQLVPVTLVSSLTSSFFIDTVSLNTIGTFNNPVGSNGLRVLSLLPRNDIAITPDNIQDQVDAFGNYGDGLNVSTTQFVTINYANQVTYASTFLYNHTSSLNSVYTDYYSRELLYTNGYYIHPAGFNFSQFNGSWIRNPTAVFPDYTYDLVYDENNGYRYATFAFETPYYSTPTTFEYVCVTLDNPSFVSTITGDRANNTCFPNYPVVDPNVAYMKTRLHAKLIGNYTDFTEQLIETAWVNGFKHVEEYGFDDGIYDVGACYYATQAGPNITYSIRLNRRAYNKATILLRIGIAQDGSVYSGDPLTFESMKVFLTDVDPKSVE